ncbi:MAG TPA: DUF1315 family protein [Marinagarivorans sp.]
MTINNPHDVEQVLAAMTPEIYARFQQAIALGRWPDGQSLSEAQKSTCINAIIVYENRFKQPEERTGFVPPKATACADESHIHRHEKPLNWVQE